MLNNRIVNSAIFDDDDQLLLSGNAPNQFLFMVPHLSPIPLPPLLLLFRNDIDECLPTPANLPLSLLPPPPLQPPLFHVWPHDPIEFTLALCLQQRPQIVFIIYKQFWKND